MLSASPTDLEANRRLADLLWESGDRPVAIPHLNAAAVSDPSHLKTWNRLSLSYQELGDIRGELRALRKILMLDRNDHKVEQRLWNLLWDSGRHREAAPLLRAAHKEGRLTPKELKRLARSVHALNDEEAEQSASLAELGEVFEDIALWKQVLLEQPGDLEANAQLASLFWELNRKKEAAPYMRVAAMASPNEAKLWRRLATCLKEIGETEEAGSALEHLAELEGASGRGKASVKQVDEGSSGSADLSMPTSPAPVPSK